MNAQFMFFYEPGVTVVHDHLLLFGMSAAYTRWTHHGESAIDVNVEFSEKVHPHEYDRIWESHHYDGIQVFEEPNVGDQAIPDLEMLSELYAALEEDGQLPNFTRVLKDFKRTL